jgi:hypothetical protein
VTVGVRNVGYCIEDLIAVSEINNFVILEISMDDDEGFGWIEGEGNLALLNQGMKKIS